MAAYRVAYQAYRESVTKLSETDTEARCYAAAKVRFEGEETPAGLHLRFSPSSDQPSCCLHMVGFCGTMVIEVEFDGGGQPKAVLRAIEQ